MTQRKTLEARVRDMPLIWPIADHVRAELERLAKKIRKLRRDDLKDPTRSQSTELTYSEGLTEALALIRKATR